MSLPAELYLELRRYLSGAADAAALEDWVVAHLQLILDSGDAAAIRLADELDVSLVELGEGIIDAPAFRERLARLAQAPAFPPVLQRSSG